MSHVPTVTYVCTYKERDNYICKNKNIRPYVAVFSVAKQTRTE